MKVLYVLLFVAVLVGGVFVGKSLESNKIQELKVQISKLQQELQKKSEGPKEGEGLEQWKTITGNGPFIFQIPPGYDVSAAAGSMFVVRADRQDEPVMRISSDGQTILIGRWGVTEWPFYNDVVTSFRVVTPLRSDIEIKVEK